MSSKQNKRTLAYMFFYALFDLFTFIYGVAVGPFQLFPHHQARFLYSEFERQFRSAKPRTILSTSLIRLEQKYFTSDAHLELQGWGGGLTQFGSKLLGVDRWGRFFV